MSVKITVAATGSLKDALRVKQQDMLIRLHKGLVDMSPVDEGTFQGAWTVDTLTMTIANNMEYAQALADGWSKQAPKGWVEAEVDKATRL